MPDQQTGLVITAHPGDFVWRAGGASLLGAEIEFFDCGDYPLDLTEQHYDRMVDIYRETNPAFVLTHALEDPYNFDHPSAAHFAQETRVVAQAMGHKPNA